MSACSSQCIASAGVRRDTDTRVACRVLRGEIQFDLPDTQYARDKLAMWATGFRVRDLPDYVCRPDGVGQQIASINRERTRVHYTPEYDPQDHYGFKCTYEVWLDDYPQTYPPTRDETMLCECVQASFAAHVIDRIKVEYDYVYSHIDYIHFRTQDYDCTCGPCVAAR